MLKQSRILQILVLTPYNTPIIMWGIFKIRDRLSIEIAKTKFQKGVVFATPFISIPEHQSMNRFFSQTL